MISLPEYAEPSPIAHILCGVEDYEAELDGCPITTAQRDGYKLALRIMYRSG